MCLISTRLAAYALAAGMASQALTASPAYAVSDTIQIPPAACMKNTPAELCWTSGLVDLTGATKFRFWVRASGYDIGDTADKRVYITRQDLNTGSWSCLGTQPCKQITVKNLPPDQFGNEQHHYISAQGNIPPAQRGPTLLRLETVGPGAPAVTQVTVTVQY